MSAIYRGLSLLGFALAIFGIFKSTSVMQYEIVICLLLMALFLQKEYEMSTYEDSDES